MNTPERLEKIVGKASTILITVKEHAFNCKSLGMMALARPIEWLRWRSDLKDE